MSKFMLEIDTDNDAFVASERYEIARILVDAGNKIADTSSHVAGALMDSNGNRVGEYRLEDK